MGSRAQPIDPQALDWANKNPDRPEAVELRAKQWAYENPDRPEAKQLMDKYATPSNPERDAADARVASKMSYLNDPATYANIMPGGGLAARGAPMVQSGLGKIASTLTGTVAGQIGIGGVAGGAGAAIHGQPVGEGAVTGALMGLGGGLAGKALGGIKSFLTSQGAKGAGVPVPAAEAYVANPAQARADYKDAVTDREGFSQKAAQTLKDLLAGTQGKVLNPLLDKKAALMSGPGISATVPTSDFRGTAAEPHIQEAWAKQGQTVPVDPNPYSGVDANQTPAPMPDKITMSGSQLMKAQRAAQDAGNFKVSPNDAKAAASATEDSIRNKQASLSLKAAMEGVAPPELRDANGNVVREGLPSLDEKIHRGMQAKNALTGLSKPTDLYRYKNNPIGDDLGAQRQYLDQQLGTNLQNEAGAMHTAASVSGQGTDVSQLAGGRGVGRTLGQMLGGSALENASRAGQAQGTLQNNPFLIQLLQQLRNGDGNQGQR